MCDTFLSWMRAAILSTYSVACYIKQYDIIYLSKWESDAFTDVIAKFSLRTRPKLQYLAKKKWEMLQKYDKGTGMIQHCVSYLQCSKEPRKQKIFSNNLIMRLDNELTEAVHLKKWSKFSEDQPTKLYHFLEKKNNQTSKREVRSWLELVEPW